MTARVVLWDAPVRLFHWALAALVVFSFTTGKVGGGWLEWHMRSGYAILALLAFRLAWGVVGSETARFASFLRGPRVTLAHARALMSRKDHPVAFGHTPTGGWMIVVMLAILAVQAASGLFVDDDIATQGPLAVKVSNAFVAKMSALHSYNQWAVAVAVALHVAAIAFYQGYLGANLIGPMVHGRAQGHAPRAAPKLAPAWLAALLFAAASAAVYYLVVVYPRSPS
jgi:cytochrome b